MATKKQDYGNDSISALKGADRVRKRPGVIFGSDGLEGCEHAVFEILSNSIDEAREGHGRTITVTRFADRSIQVEDAGRGCPVDWNEKEQRYNWELVYCELYAGGKYDNVSGDNYEYSLGLNGLGACATQYASRYMDVTVWRDGFEYTLHFQRGEIVGELGKTPLPKSQARKTGTRTRWLPDLDVFTDIAIPAEYFTDVMKRQAVVNAGVTFRFRNETEPGRFEEAEFLYENGIMDYVTELAGEGSLTAPVFWQTEKKGVDLKDHPSLQVREYIYDMAPVMRAADLVICRAGASTVSELTALGVPAIMVPSPYVTNNHQEKNARALETHGGVEVLLEQDSSGQALFQAAAGILRDDARREAMASAMAELGIRDAAQRIYETVQELL